MIQRNMSLIANNPIKKAQYFQRMLASFSWKGIQKGELDGYPDGFLQKNQA
jgi:hypothetical protein